MKRGEAVFALLFLISISLVSAESSCNLNVTLLNQDPYPAIPGESVKLVFQINGVSNANCGTVRFEVKENFPFSVDPSSENPISIESGAYLAKYSSFYLAPYKIRIDKDSLEGDIPLEVLFSSSEQAGITEYKEFDINVKDTRADFEVYVKDYNAQTKTFTLEILNIAKVDVEALTIQIPVQDNIDTKGANVAVVGSLDSNEYTTADFEGVLKKGNLNFNILYTDSINERREINKTIYFDPASFDGVNQTSMSGWWYVLIVLVIAAAVWIFVRSRKKKKKFR